MIVCRLSKRPSKGLIKRASERARGDGGGERGELWRARFKADELPVGVSAARCPNIISEDLTLQCSSHFLALRHGRLC
jgi:hypothetical protein